MDRLASLAAALVEMKVDVILAGDGTRAKAAKQATREIPIVVAERAAEIKGKLAEIDRRYKWNAKQYRWSTTTPPAIRIFGIRLRDLHRLLYFRVQRWPQLDHSEIVRVIVHHLAHGQESGARIAEFLARHWVPKISNEEVTAILAKPRKWTAEELGHHIGLLLIERRLLGITSIRPNMPS
jgi:hypothetical protein